MSTLTNHIVHKVLVQLNIDDQQTALGIKNQIAVFVQKELFPLLEEYFNELEQQFQGNHLQLPALTIQLHTTKRIFDSLGRSTNMLAVDHLLNQFRQQVEQQLQQWNREILSSPVTKDSMVNRARSLNALDGRKKPSEDAPSNMTPSQRTVESIIYILEHGHRPWWLRENEKVLFFSDWNTMDGSLKESIKKPKLQVFLRGIVHQPIILKRLIYQFSNHQLEKIYHELINYNSELTFVQFYKTLVNSFSSSKFRMAFWQMVFGALSKTYFDKNYIDDAQHLWKIGMEEHPKSHEMIFRIIDQIVLTASQFHHQESWSNPRTFSQFKSNYNSLKLKKNNSIDKSTTETNKKDLINQLGQLWETKDNITVRERLSEEKRQEEEPAPSTPETDEARLSEGIHVDQAGLVLLHPFICQLFQSTNLLDQDKNIQNKTQAVHLLHYLATKQENAFEQEMVFEKYCCNVGLETSLEREVSLSQKMKGAAEELLEAAIGHWTALKNTQGNTLRAEYLNRKGKLVTQGNYHKLIIERKTQDILLDRLPWNIGLVKFPWKKQLLFVEWA
ncbi:hypothetical protein FKX85_15735 [Echinicola soli]|uniref:Uncharacterized protein n=1 Tax=Echinicola soli TaxID=2591634 RepID=A0A514CKT5_9BACT|nr:contractile injection system tape measure protein [Echinicola soli]QDH80412.1 hypothetical protein FKX85_15735 [Echinicola soli]